MRAGSIRRLFGIPQPDGAAPGLEDDALAAGRDMAADVAPAPPPLPAARPETVIIAALSQKVLHSWLQNRHQTRYPMVLNLRNNRPGEVRLLLAAVGSALHTIGAGPVERERAQGFLAGIGGTLPPDEPEPADMVAQLHEARLTAEAYAACAGALGRRTVVVRRYLDFLAARLEIADEVARSINRRFAS